jgi:CheY-like chemotaxis protein
MSPPIITTLEVPVFTTKLPASETKTHARSQSPPHISLPKISSPVAPSHHDDHGQKHDSVPTIRVQEKRTLLLVDDNKINLKVLSAIVAKLGYDYQLATNGQEALDIYLQYPKRFSALLLDISMPVMDGLEATRRVRTHEHSNHLVAVPVLTLTGLSSDSTHKEALESGVNVFLTKPVKSQRLREALESVGLSMP